jgi:monofunctional biosynthetic peptidoglycan transglycosylase
MIDTGAPVAVADTLAHEAPPSWVRNVAAAPSSTAAVCVMLLRSAYRVVARITLLALPVVFAWSWVAPLDGPIAVVRCAATVAALTAAPVVWLRWADPPSTSYMFCTRRGLWPAGSAPTAIEHRWVRLDDIAPAMCLAVIVSEDPYFFWHAGFNPIELLRAHRYNRHERKRGRMRRGGSTISQQTAKNLFLLPVQSYARKLVEAIFTAWIEGLWPKRRILEMYLNVVQFADDVFGVEAAARRFFGVGARDLTSDQSALLTAALRRPQLYRVEAPPPYMRELQRGILQRMAWCGEGMLAQLERK